MRRLKITRKKSFFGARRPWFIHHTHPGKDPRDPESTWAPGHVMGIRIQNGQTVSIPIREERCAVLVYACTATGASGGPCFYVDAGRENVELEIVPRRSLFGERSYPLRPHKDGAQKRPRFT